MINYVASSRVKFLLVETGDYNVFHLSVMFLSFPLFTNISFFSLLTICSVSSQPTPSLLCVVVAISFCVLWFIPPNFNAESSMHVHHYILGIMCMCNAPVLHASWTFPESVSNTSCYEQHVGSLPSFPPIFNVCYIWVL